MAVTFTDTEIDAWLANMRTQLLSNADLSDMLAVVPNSNPAHKALYTAHISASNAPVMPAISLHFPHAGGNRVMSSIHGTLHVDIWVPDSGPIAMLSGALAIHKRVRQMLHKSHLRLNCPFTTNFWKVKYMVLGPVEDLYETEYSTVHLSTQYSVTLSERTVDSVFPVG